MYLLHLYDTLPVLGHAFNFVTALYCVPVRVCRRMIPGTCAEAASCQPPYSSAKAPLRPAVHPQDCATAGKQVPETANPTTQ